MVKKRAFEDFFSSRPFIFIIPDFDNEILKFSQKIGKKIDDIFLFCLLVYKSLFYN
jgi:hypothetical protein